MLIVSFEVVCDISSDPMVTSGVNPLMVVIYGIQRSLVKRKINSAVFHPDILARGGKIEF